MATAQTVTRVEVGPLSAEVLKAGHGEPLVYLHGAFGYKGWNPFLDRLSERFTVYAPLHPGFGEPDSVKQLDDILDIVLYHFDLLDALGLDAPHLVGHFFGAMIAAEMAAVCPHRMSRMVLASPAGLWLDDKPGVDYFVVLPDNLRSLLFQDPDSDLAKGILPDVDTDEQRMTRNVERGLSLSTVGKYLWPIPDKGLKKRLGRIKVPTQVVVAENDQIVPPAYGDEIVARIPGAKLQVVPNASHLFIHEQPDDFAGMVADFLAG
jgi:pimeloyl-ACP methyl ester carboxylesterase